MSAIIAVALEIVQPNHPDKEEILHYVDLPDNIKRDLSSNLKLYLQAIELFGYEAKKIRKMMVMGNTGI